MRSLQALIKPIYSSLTQQPALKRGIGNCYLQKLHIGHSICKAAGECTHEMQSSSCKAACSITAGLHAHSQMWR